MLVILDPRIGDKVGMQIQAISKYSPRNPTLISMGLGISIIQNDPGLILGSKLNNVSHNRLPIKLFAPLDSP